MYMSIIDNDKDNDSKESPNNWSIGNKKVILDSE